MPLWFGCQKTIFQHPEKFSGEQTYQSESSKYWRQLRNSYFKWFDHWNKTFLYEWESRGEKRGGDSFKMNECGLRSRTKTPDQFTPLTHRCVWRYNTMCSANISFHWILCAVCTTERSRGGAKKKTKPGISVAEEPIMFCSGACFRCQT